MKIAFQALAISLLFLVVGLLAGDYLELRQQVSYINAKQKSDSAFKQKENAEAHSESSHIKDDKCGNDAAYCDKEPPETYAIFGKSLKITDSFIALFTLVIAIWTIRLFKEAKDTSRKELRAYVALEHIFFPSEERDVGRDPGVPLDSGVTIRIRNHGKTPAHDLTIWKGEPLKQQPKEGFAYRVTSEPLVGKQMLHPNQHFSIPLGGVLADQNASHVWFCIYGHIDYWDIYDSQWRTNFCYVREPHGSGYRFAAYKDHNSEEHLGNRRPS